MIKFAAIFLLSFILMSTAMASNFTYEIERAGYPFGKSDQMGSVDSSKFIEAFRAYPWREQAGQANGGTEATISVKNRTAETTLFVSVVGNSAKYAYIIGIVYQKPQRPLLGLISRQPAKWVDMYVTENPADVEAIFGIYFSSELNATLRKLEKLEKFDSQPAARGS